jgi:stage II sporulation protein D
MLIIIIPTIISGLYSDEEKYINEKEEIFVDSKNSVIHVKNNLNREDKINNNILAYIKEKDEVILFSIEDYLKGVVAAEMPASFHIEALKAQAVAARTYIYNKVINKDDSEEHKGAHICNDPEHCKAWITKEEAFLKWTEDEREEYWDKIVKAVEGTESQVILYNNIPIDAVFHSTCSGWTENSEEVWSNKIEYLRSVESFGDDISPKFNSHVEVTKKDFIERIKENFDIEILIDEVSEDIIEKVIKTEGNNVREIYIKGNVLNGAEMRRVFGLNSTNFNITFEDEKVIFSVWGNGHEVGMSQYGANYMAVRNKSYEDILLYYYSGVKIEKKELYSFLN